MAKKFKDMQDRTPEDVVCSKCRRIILPASRAVAYRERDIQDAVATHRCRPQDESKRDFQDEVR